MKLVVVRDQRAVIQRTDIPQTVLKQGSMPVRLPILRGDSFSVALLKERGRDLWAGISLTEGSFSIYLTLPTLRRI